MLDFEKEHLEFAEGVTKLKLSADLESGKLSQDMIKVLKNPLKLITMSLSDRPLCGNQDYVFDEEAQLKLLAENSALSSNQYDLASAIRNN